MFKKLLLTGVFLSFFSSLSLAQDEQVTVIGTLIKGTPIDSGSPISTFDAESIESQGNLNIVELIKMVPGSSGMDGESNQFGSNGAEGIANINFDEQKFFNAIALIAICHQCSIVIWK